MPVCALTPSLPDSASYIRGSLGQLRPSISPTHAIKATRAAFPNPLRPDGSFVAMGQSQGGGAASSFAENQASKPIDGYQGTVAIAPPTRIMDQVNQALVNTSLPFGAITIGTQPNVIARPEGKFKRPLLVLSGEADVAIPVTTV
ncbi:hypothetical protein CONLIGDRAFT_678711 [Coniochaeta ligniaria NRRL 30616]|uniref:Uncharacterized protein n=1 Tax=Coniochaeta ligniaria NRRL 30616 TaxID=1408157 RepID=A0A1J7IX73_9PEZI|nr:hypothetical protein CONLIGDRAFT_678711 [Coniochaeta ligniaria NRRL 30616]